MPPYLAKHQKPDRPRQSAGRVPHAMQPKRLWLQKHAWLNPGGLASCRLGDGLWQNGSATEVGSPSPTPYPQCTSTKFPTGSRHTFFTLSLAAATGPRLTRSWKSVSRCTWKPPSSCRALWHPPALDSLGNRARSSGCACDAHRKCFTSLSNRGVGTPSLLCHMHALAAPGTLMTRAFQRAFCGSTMQCTDTSLPLTQHTLVTQGAAFRCHAISFCRASILA